MSYRTGLSMWDHAVAVPRLRKRTSQPNRIRRKPMRNFIHGALIAAGIAVVPVIMSSHNVALAQSAGVPASEATLLCREARQGEKVMARMVNGTSRDLICRRIRVVMQPNLKVIGAVSVNAG